KFREPAAPESSEFWLRRRLIVSGEAGTFTLPSGKQGAMLRAYDKASGKGVGAVYMPQGVTGTPTTYMAGGKQYIVLAIGGPNFPAEFVAYKLPWFRARRKNNVVSDNHLERNHQGLGNALIVPIKTTYELTAQARNAGSGWGDC